jgi:hypothetical protein
LAFRRTDQGGQASLARTGTWATSRQVHEGARHRPLLAIASQFSGINAIMYYALFKAAAPAAIPLSRQ